MGECESGDSCVVEEDTIENIRFSVTMVGTGYKNKSTTYPMTFIESEGEDVT